MPHAVEAGSIAGLVPRERLERIADYLAVALAVSLPWSSTATGIFAALWFLAVLPTLGTSRWREVMLSPAGGLPILFVLLALLGVLWSQVPVGERFVSVVPFARLLAIPLLICQFARSPRGVYVIYGLIASCTILMIASFWSYIGVGYPLRPKQDGVPVKDYIVQSGLFTICAFALLEMAIELWARQRRRSVAVLLLAAAFLANIALVATSRTTLLVLAVLLVLFALRRGSWKAGFAVIGTGVVLAAIAWLASPYLRERITRVVVEIHEYQTKSAGTSSGMRLEFWRNSIKLIAQAPVIGYGTGTLAAKFKDVTSDNSIIPNADNPHNQTFTVAIQLGLVGIVILYALWLFHLLLFRGGDWVAWFGMVVVVQSVVGSLVNSYLFDFTPGWTYAVCVGTAGGMMLRQKTTANVTTHRT